MNERLTGNTVPLCTVSGQYPVITPDPSIPKGTDTLTSFTPQRPQTPSLLFSLCVAVNL